MCHKEGISCFPNVGRAGGLDSRLDLEEWLPEWAHRTSSQGDCNLWHLQKAGDSGSLSANCWFHHFSHDQESQNNFVLEYSTLAVFHDQTAAAPVSFKAICCLLDLLQQNGTLSAASLPLDSAFRASGNVSNGETSIALSTLVERDSGKQKFLAF